MIFQDTCTSSIEPICSPGLVRNSQTSLLLTSLACVATPGLTHRSQEKDRTERSIWDGVRSVDSHVQEILCTCMCYYELLKEQCLLLVVWGLIDKQLRNAEIFLNPTSSVLIRWISSIRGPLNYWSHNPQRSLRVLLPPQIQRCILTLVDIQSIIRVNNRKETIFISCDLQNSQCK